jgi:membrane fusion protein (multidrug efflux system)
MKRQGTILIWSASLLLAAAGGYLFFIGEDADSDGRGFERTTPVKVQSVTMGEFADVIEAIGTTRANESVVLTARVSETVQTINFEDGMWVEEGTILIELTNSEEVAVVREREAAVKEALQQFERIRDLVKTGNASQAALDLRVRSLEEERSRLAAAEARIADRIIRAPFSGVLGLRNVSQGTLVSPGTQITTLDDIDIIKLDFSVPERFISVLADGQTISAKAAAFNDRPFEGAILTVNSRVDPITRAVTVRAIIPNPDRNLRPGMLMTVELSSNTRMSLEISEGAVIPVGRETFVFLLKEDMTVERIAVLLGTRRRGKVEVKAGLEEGQKVVTSGTMRLRSGSKVSLPTAAGGGQRQGRERGDS